MPELALCLKDREMSRHPVRDQPIRIGRDPSNEVVIENVGVSRHHATVFCEGGVYQVRDEGSQNGIFVNGQRVAAQVLQEGDAIQLGKFSLRFSMTETPAAQQSLTPSRRGGARDPMKTMALDQADVQKLLANPSPRMVNATPANDDSEEAASDGTGKVLGFGVLGILVVSVIAYMILIR